MAGYERKTLALKFDDPELDGLVVRMKRLPIGDLFAVTELADLGDDLKANQEGLDRLLTTVGAALLSWNLEEDGVPVAAEKGAPAHDAAPGCCSLEDGDRHPATGLYSTDLDLLFAVITAWVDAASGVARPLPTTSNSGLPSLAEFEAMAARSESLSSSSTPEPSSESFSVSAATP